MRSHLPPARRIFASSPALAIVVACGGGAGGLGHPPADLVLRGGRLHDGRRPELGRRGRGAGGGSCTSDRTPCPGLIGPDRGRGLARRDGPARLPGRARPPHQQRGRAGRMPPERPHDRPGGARFDSRLRPRRARPPVGPGQRLAAPALSRRQSVAAALDGAVPDRPARLDAADGHSVWVNSRALALAGITRDTPDPPNGRIERDAPRGAERDAAGDARWTWCMRVVPARTEAELAAGLDAGAAGGQPVRHHHLFGPPPRSRCSAPTRRPTARAAHRARRRRDPSRSRRARQHRAARPPVARARTRRRGSGRSRSRSSRTG